MATTTSQINEIKEDLSDAYTALGNKGATLPAANARGTSNLASTVATIPAANPTNKAWSANQYGAVSKRSFAFTSTSFSGITSVGDAGMRYAYYTAPVTGVVSFTDLTSVAATTSSSYSAFEGAFSETKISSISFPSLVTIPSSSYGDGPFYYCCNNASYLSSVSFPELTTIGDKGLNNAFTHIGYFVTISISFPKLQSVGKSGMNYCFSSSSKMSNTVSFPELVSIDQYGMRGTFKGCTDLRKVYFNKLGGSDPSTNIHADAFGTETFPSQVTEIHFPSTSQSAVEALTGYSVKFGATNATIYFDL